MRFDAIFMTRHRLFCDKTHYFSVWRQNALAGFSFPPLLTETVFLGESALSHISPTFPLSDETTFNYISRRQGTQTEKSLYLEIALNGVNAFCYKPPHLLIRKTSE